MKRFILVFAMNEEYAPFARLIDQPIEVFKTHVRTKIANHEVLMMTTGISVFNTYKIAPIIDDFKPTEVIQVGSCAGLKNQPIGDVIFARTFYHSDLDLTQFERVKGRLERGLKPKKNNAVLVSGSAFLSSPQAKQDIVQNFDADGFDMESFGFYTICEQLGVPFLSIRGVSDNGDDNASKNFQTNLSIAAKSAAEATLQYLRAQ
jgi:adenosylhomocysteine nucleosidase